MARPVLSPQEIIAALRKTGGAKAAAAHLLRISPRTLQRRLHQMRPFSLGPEPSADQLFRHQINLLMLKKALAGDARCLIFLLKAAGWGREIVEPVLWKGYPQN